MTVSRLAADLSWSVSEMLLNDEYYVERNVFEFLDSSDIKFLICDYLDDYDRLSLYSMFKRVYPEAGVDILRGVNYNQNKIVEFLKGYFNDDDVRLTWVHNKHAMQKFIKNSNKAVLKLSLADNVLVLIDSDRFGALVAYSGDIESGDVKDI